MIPETHYTWSGDISIAYQVIGEGPVDLVVVPGWVSNIDLFWEEPSFVRFFQGLTAFSRVLLFDKRGCGLSDKVLHAPTLEERMDDVLAVMDAVGSERASLFGYSEGGSMSSLFAASYPERTEALIICGGYARKLKTEDYEWGTSEEENEAYFEALPDVWGGPVGIETIAPSMAKDARFRQWWAKFLRNSASITTSILVSRANTSVDIRHILPSIQVPTLILHARYDPMVTIENGRYLAEQIPGATLVELDTPDHLPWVGNPEQVLAEVRRFLTGKHDMHDVDRAVVTVLFTDIVDSTKLASELGDTAWRDLLEAHNVAVRRELEIHRGKEVKSTGDGFHAVFNGPARGIRCGLAIQEATNRIGLSVRVGMHTGECELRSNQIEGVAVHIAARVAALARGGEVLVSQTVKDLVAGANFSFEDRGVHALKGVPDEWRVLAVL
ncbi:MAG: adenylate/guanylate cyclase domain-containing protein [Arenicellales bacterium]|nr:adenylate/guanylate cyclase domain-containing protein [Arenicellales bacterium]